MGRQRDRESELVESALDRTTDSLTLSIGSLATSLGTDATDLMTGVAASVPLVGSIVKAGLVTRAWTKGKAAERERLQFEEVIVRAAVATQQGESGMALADLATYCDDPSFRRRVHGAVRAMQDGTPCDEVIPHLASLVAAYAPRTPATDMLFRRCASLLCDMLPSDVTATHVLLRGLGALNENVFRIKPLHLSGDDEWIISASRVRGDDLKSVIARASGLPAAERLLDEHGFIRTWEMTPADGAASHEVELHRWSIEWRDLSLLLIVFGIDAPLAKEFHEL